MELTHEERTTIRAALLWWKETTDPRGEYDNGYFRHEDETFADGTEPLTNLEIDSLLDKL